MTGVPVSADMLADRVVGVHNGNTLAVLMAGKSPRENAFGARIDMPERDQPFGEPGEAA